MDWTGCKLRTYRCD